MDVLARQSGLAHNDCVLTAVSLITPRADLFAVQQIGQHRAVGGIGGGGGYPWISLLWLSTPR